MGPLDILHVAPYAPAAWAMGGIPRVVAAQTRALAARGHRVTVLSTDVGGASRLPAPGSDGAGAANPRQLVARNVSNRLASRHQLYLPRGLGRLLREATARAAVVHLHACRNLPGLLASRRARRRGIPYVIQPNGTAPRIERKRLVKWVLDRLGGRMVLRGADRVVAVSGAEVAQLTRLGVPRDRITEIPNPVDLDEIDDLDGRPTMAPGRPTVAYLGQLTPRKRVDLVVRAVALLGRPDVRLVIAGGDDAGARPLRRLAGRLGIGAQTDLVGVLEGVDRLELLRRATVVAYPTDDEIFGLVPVESLLAGTPVVVADGSGCAEVVRRLGGGQVVPGGDAAALTGALRRVIAAPAEWVEPVGEAARRARRWYGSDEVARQLEVLYVETIRRATGDGA